MLPLIYKYITLFINIEPLTPGRAPGGGGLRPLGRGRALHLVNSTGSRKINGLLPAELFYQGNVLPFVLRSMPIVIVF